jgi:radical SAM protein with 4Fe4S-binding SPASM domain
MLDHGVDFPDVVRIETAGRCNFRCKHCAIKNLRGLLSFESFVDIFQRLPRVPRVLVLYHGGEPMLNKDLEKIVKYAHNQGVQKTTLVTNASLIRPIPHLTEMRVSFDGQSPEENDFIRMGSNFHKHAPKVLEVAKQQRVVINNTYATGGEAPTVPQYLKDYFGDAAEYKSVPMRQWSVQDTPYGEIVSRPTGARYCNNLFETFTILANGDVVKCCEDLNGDFVHGNIFQNSATELWERMRDIRTNFAKGKYPEQCQKCWVVAGRYVK